MKNGLRNWRKDIIRIDGTNGVIKLNVSITPPYLLRKFYSNLIWNFPTTQKIIYLTFDDGPIEEVTPFVLDQLKQYNAKATFFCIGENVKRYPEIFQRLKSEGHAVGNHTYHHLNGWKTNDKVYVEDIDRANKLIQSKLFRPPYGRIKKAQISFLANIYSLIMWDVLSYDFDKNTSPEECLNNVTQYAKPGSILVFHDSIKAKKNLFYTLPKTLTHFSEEGFEFRRVEG